MHFRLCTIGRQNRAQKIYSHTFRMQTHQGEHLWLEFLCCVLYHWHQLDLSAFFQLIDFAELAAGPMCETDYSAWMFG